MLAIGFAAKELFDRSALWVGDRELVERFGIEPKALPESELPDKAQRPSSTIFFEELNNHGVDFQYTNGPDDLFHLADTLGGGVAAVDFDLDDQTDLLFVDGGNPIALSATEHGDIYCYRQGQRLKFQETSDEAGLRWNGYGHGCSICDYNEDGFPDLFVTGFYGSRLFTNLGDGTFQEVIDFASATDERWCATAAWADLDSDGDQDLYIACYTDTPPIAPSRVCTAAERRIHCNPREDNGVPDLLFENLGDGRFQNQSAESGIAKFSEYGLGVMIADLNANGRPEIFVANDGDRNMLFAQHQDLEYREFAVQAGVAFNGEGETMGSMGIGCADFNGNGHLDLLTTNFAFERNVLFSNLGSLTFIDRSRGTDVDKNSRNSVGWSAVPLDADCDGHTDLFIANGHVTDMPQQDFRQHALLLDGASGDLMQVSGGGTYFAEKWHGRGACRADLNGDGRSDLIVSHIDSPASLLLNSAADNNNSLSIRLIGTSSSRAAESVRMHARTAGGVQAFLYARNGGYLSAHSDALIVGLGREDSVTIEVFWPGGDPQVVEDLPANSVVRIIEGQGRVVEIAEP